MRPSASPVGTVEMWSFKELETLHIANKRVTLIRNVTLEVDDGAHHWST